MCRGAYASPGPKRTLDAWVNSGFVFSDEPGKPLSPVTFANAPYRVAKRAKLPSTRPHSLQHTTAAFILSAGGNPVAASKVLGHSEEGTTLKIYGHVIGLDERRAMRSVDKALRRSLSRSRAQGTKRAQINGLMW